MRERIENFFGFLFFLGVIGWLVWEFQPLDRLHDTPTLYYKRSLCLYAEPCRTIWGSASFRLIAESQTAALLINEGVPTVYALQDCQVWDDHDWACATPMFGGYIGRRDGVWYSGDENLHAAEWRFTWLMEQQSPDANQLPGPQ